MARAMVGPDGGLVGPGGGLVGPEEGGTIIGPFPTFFRIAAILIMWALIVAGRQ